MMSNKNKIDSYFKEGLNDMNVIPPADVWSNISKNLNNESGNRKAIFWIAIAASITVFAGISGLLYFQHSKSGHINSTEEFVVRAPKSNGSTLKTPAKSIDKPTAQFEIEESSGQSISEYSIAQSETKQTEQVISSVNSNSGIVFTSESAAKDAGDKSEASIKNSGSEILRAIEKNGAIAFYVPVSITVKKLQSIVSNIPIFLDRNIVKTDTVITLDILLAIEEPTDIAEAKNRWAIGGQMAPLYSYRNITEVNAPGISKSSMDDIEKAVITYASGVMVDYSASSRLTFQTGIYYMKMGQQVDDVSHFTRSPSKSAIMSNNLDYYSATSAVSNSTGTIQTVSSGNLYFAGSVTNDRSEYSPGNLALQPADENIKYKIKQSFEFLEVPFIAKYTIIDRKMNVHLLGGMSTHVLVNSKAELTSNNNVTDTGTTTDIKTMNYSSSIGFGCVYKLSGNLFLSVEPTFKYYLNSFNSSESIKLHPYAFGLYSGISFKF